MTDWAAKLDHLEPTDEQLADDPKGKMQDRFKLIEAIRSLLDGRPNNAELKKLMQDKGRVPITKDTAALEAGVNRRLFSGPMSANPEISELLKDLKPEFGVAEATTARLKKQDASIKELTQQLVASRSATAAQVARIDALRLELKKAKGQIERLKEGKDDA